MKTITHPASNWLLATRNYALLFGLILTISTSAFAEDPNWGQKQDNWHSTYEDPNGNTIPATMFTTDWHDGNCWLSQNNGFGFGARPPDETVWACIEPKPPSPAIVGDAECSRLSIQPWSWTGAPNIELNIESNAGTISCGVCIGIGDKINYDSVTQGHGTLNVYGGTIITPTAPEGPEGDISGLWVGGGESKTGDCYGVVNMYGGQITVPRVAVYYGVVNLYGGLLYNTGTDVNADFVISESRTMNKINLCDDGNDQTPPGELRLKGNRTEQVNYYIQRGRICPCGGQNSLSITFDGNSTSVKADGPFYVDCAATGANNGSSWANAYKCLQDALWSAGSGTVIWVAEGTYRPDEDTNHPTGTNDRNATFQLINNVAIYGGFPTGGGSWASRKPNIYKAILSGDIGVADNNSDNSYNVVTGWSINSSSILDGFTITAGNVIGYGGGMWNNAGSPTVTNCTFSGNSAYYGGGMWNETNSCPLLINCTFSGNSGSYGGGMSNFLSRPALINCTFIGNSASVSGGGIYNYDSSPTLTNCIFWGNNAPAGAQIYNEGSSSPAITFSDVQGGWTGTGNINANPLFVDADGPDNVVGTEDDNLRLLSGSPCIDAGDNTAVPGGVVTDLDGLSRFFNDTATVDTGNGTPPVVDMGAYEYRPLIFVDASATGGNNGSSWANAYNSLQVALAAAEPNYEIWVAQGTYKPGPDRFYSFNLENGVAIYGGFPTGGGNWASRDPNAYETILSGDIGVADNNSDNSYHVVTGSNTDSTAILDGFTITAGNADVNSQPLERGGGMYDSNGSPTINNCIFSGNTSLGVGGGIFCSNSSCPTLTNCTFIGNSTLGWGGGMRNNSSNPILTNCTFIGNSASRNGGGMHNNSSSPTVTNCIFIGNSATTAGGGGMWNNNSSPLVANCTFTGNSGPTGSGMYNYGSSSPTLTDCNFSGNSASEYGDGICNMYTSVINISAGGNIYMSDEFYVTEYSRIQGTGNIIVELGGEMIIDFGAVVDMNDPNDPDVTGSIQCDGLLKVKNNGQLTHADVNISRQAGGLFGKFEIEDSAQATNLDIFTDGDRFMEVDPCTFTGNIANNRIYVTITEGQNGTLEGILELRGLDMSEPDCNFDDPNVLYCQVDESNMPDFNTVSWTLERLEVAPGARVSLADRFNSGNGNPEVLYVKNLILGADCNLNVGFERLYFQNLSGDVNSIMRDALLAISLNDMNFDSNEEFESRVSNNNYINPADPNLNRIHVERVFGQQPDPNGMMIMRNLEDEYGQMISARAKTEYAPASEDEVRIRFNYLFNTSDPCAQIVVYLSDVAELLPIDPNNPDFNDHYKYVDCISNPPEGRPGSFDSNRFGNFEMFVSTDGLDLSGGTWLELVLLEPQPGGFFARYDKQFETLDGGGASACVDDEEVGIYCGWGVCLDLNGDRIVTESDFMRVISGAGSSDDRTACREGGFTSDGYTDSYDTRAWDWTLNLPRQNYCGEMRIPLTGSASGFAFGGFGGFEGPVNKLNLAGLDDLLLTGKRGAADAQTKMKDRFYVFDDGGAYLQWLDPCSQRCNIRVVRGAGDYLYQITTESGVSRLDEIVEQVVPTGEIACPNEPRYHLQATVYVGVHPDGLGHFFGRPVLDAAFDTNTSAIYVVPVVVDPQGEDANAYTAAAKLQLAPGQNPPYSLVKLYDGPVLEGDNQCKYRNTLREIELDDACNVYVTNAHIMNESDILWKFEPGGAVQRLNLVDPNGPCHIPAPTAMYVSKATNVLYLASSQPGAVPNQVVIYGLSTETLTPVRTITVSGMQYVTGITEDLTTGSLWVAGFSFNSRQPSAYTLPFYDPNLAKVPLRVNNVSALCVLGAGDLAMPLSIVWTGALPPPELCGGADLNGSNRVNLADLAILAKHWLNIDCVAPGNCEGADLEPHAFGDGDVDIWDLRILADHWLNTACLGP